MDCDDTHISFPLNHSQFYAFFRNWFSSLKSNQILTSRKYVSSLFVLSNRILLHAKVLPDTFPTCTLIHLVLYDRNSGNFSKNNWQPETPPTLPWCFFCVSSSRDLFPSLDGKHHSLMISLSPFSCRSIQKVKTHAHYQNYLPQSILFV